MKKIEAVNIGENIKNIRIQKGFDQKQIAGMLNVSPKTISSWECGRTEPNMDTTVKLCDIFGCKLTDIAGTTSSEEEGNSVEELTIIEKYRSADETTKEMVNRVLGIRRDLDGKP